MKYKKTCAIAGVIVGVAIVATNLQVSVTTPVVQATSSSFEGSDLQKMLVADGYTVSKTASSTEWNNTSKGYRKGVAGTFTTADNKTVTVLNGIITSIK